MEILAPAGHPEVLKAAVFAGADAVYLGGPAFGARAAAKNFTREQLREAVAFCHGRGVRVHVTVNTLLKDRELPQALEFTAFLCSLGVDAVLVQDMGLFFALREQAPELPLHASTQMGLHTTAGVKLLAELGASRAVLARELSLAEIREISAAVSVELEAFVHGALCMSLSGQCYLSAALGGRSGNRGMCAQPCRLPFGSPGGTGHDLSLKDLSFSQRLKELEQAGVCSAKIEGRMKRPEYVAAAVSACRRAADGRPASPELLENLESVFSRSGFTDGYLTGRRGVSMFGVRTKENVAGATEKVFSSLRSLYRNERPCVKISFRLESGKELLQLTAQDQEGRRTSACAAAGEDLPLLGPERCREQLQKTGGTPFSAAEITLPDAGVKATVSQLNGLRRQVLEDLLALRSASRPIPFRGRPYAPAPRKAGTPAPLLPVRAFFRSPDQIPPEAAACEAVVLPLHTAERDLQELRSRGFSRILLEQPRAFFGGEAALEALMKQRMAAGFREFTVGSLDGLALARKLGAAAHGTFGLNIFNTASLEAFARLGLASAELSFELAGRDMTALGGSLPRGAMVYGRQALMLTRNCPLANSPKGCLHCQSADCLTDRMKKKFPVICTGTGDARYSEVLNSVPLWLGDKQRELSSLDFQALRFTVESPVETAAVLRALFRQEPPEFDYTRGQFTRGVE